MVTFYLSVVKSYIICDYGYEKQFISHFLSKISEKTHRIVLF